MVSIGFDITENSLYKCLACFEYSSVDKIDYTIFCEAVENAINPRAKGLKNLRKFKTEEQIYEYIAEQCEIYFPLGSLCQDHDYDSKPQSPSSFLLLPYTLTSIQNLEQLRSTSWKESFVKGLLR